MLLNNRQSIELNWTTKKSSASFPNVLILILLLQLVVDKLDLPGSLLTMWTCRQDKIIKIENKAIFLPTHSQCSLPYEENDCLLCNTGLWAVY